MKANYIRVFPVGQNSSKRTACHVIAITSKPQYLSGHNSMGTDCLKLPSLENTKPKRKIKKPKRGHGAEFPTPPLRRGERENSRLHVVGDEETETHAGAHPDTRPLSLESTGKLTN